MAFKPSLRFVLLLLLFHAIAASVIFATMLPLAAKLGMFMLVLLSLLYYFTRDVFLLFPDSWREISFDKNIVSVVTRKGSVFSGKIAGMSVVSPYFAVLHIRLDGGRLPISRTIFPDALDTGAFRELCVFLKFPQ